MSLMSCGLNTISGPLDQRVSHEERVVERHVVVHRAVNQQQTPFERQYCTLAVRPRRSHPRKPLSGCTASSASIFGIVEKNQKCFGTVHHRLNRAPMMTTTKSPSMEAAIRRLMVV